MYCCAACGAHLAQYKASGSRHVFKMFNATGTLDLKYSGAVQLLFWVLLLPGTPKGPNPHDRIDDSSARSGRGVAGQGVKSHEATFQSEVACNKKLVETMFATRNKCIASSNKCLTSSNKKLSGTRGYERGSWHRDSNGAFRASLPKGGETGRTTRILTSLRSE